MEAMRWGFPPPPNLGSRPVTNVRNVASPYWRGWLKPEFRCLVPATSFCDYTDIQGGYRGIKRITSFRVAKPMRKLRWANAWRGELAGRYADFTEGAR
jgi:putative SOS response-associated peptidase YedK